MPGVKGLMVARGWGLRADICLGGWMGGNGVAGLMFACGEVGEGVDGG